LLASARQENKERKHSESSKQPKLKRDTEENKKLKMRLTLLKASFLAAWLFADSEDATTTRPSLLERGLELLLLLAWVPDRPAPAVLFGLVLPDGVLLLSTVSVDDDTAALISEDEVGIVASPLTTVSLSPTEDWTTFF